MPGTVVRFNPAEPGATPAPFPRATGPQRLTDYGTRGLDP